MPQIIFSDGFRNLVRFEIKKEKEDLSAYLSGSFNCFGEGSIEMDERDGKWIKEIYLTPGIYYYKILINQYSVFNEKRERIEKPEELKIYQEKPYHDPNDFRFSYAIKNFKIIRIIAPPETKSVYVVDGRNDKIKSNDYFKNKFFTIWEFVLKKSNKYTFIVDGKEYPENGYFEFNYNKKKEFESGIIYQIFPDRFKRSEDLKLNIKLKKWGTKPNRSEFFGGNIKGIIEEIPYIKSLGVKYIYLNPFFRSHSNHRYDVDDYFSIDPLLGSIDDLINLGKELEKNNMGMIIDLVFHHTSVHFFAFQDAIKKGKDSEYFNWYKFLKDKPSIYTGVFFYGNIPDYETFRGVGNMPKLNWNNKNVQDYILSVVKYYMNIPGVAGFRYDVSDSINLERIKILLENIRKMNDRIFNIAEIWCPAPIYTEDSLYDGVMNYTLRENIINLMKNKLSFERFSANLLKLRFDYGESVLKNSMNLLGSHDTERIFTVLKNNKNALKLAYTILYFMDGMPTIFYGDETCLKGGNDPDCRRCYPWGKQDLETIEFFRKIGNLRNKYGELFDNSFLKISRKGKNFMEIKRIGDEYSLVLISFFGNRGNIKNIENIILKNNVKILRNKINFYKYGFVIYITKNKKIKV